jgi:hypothetical protein
MSQRSCLNSTSGRRRKPSTDISLGVADFRNGVNSGRCGSSVHCGEQVKLGASVARGIGPPIGETSFRFLLDNAAMIE